MKFKAIAPWVLLFIFVAWVSKQAIPTKDKENSLAIHEFSHLPVVYQGRLKPYDTLARNSLIIISDRQSFRDQNGNKRPAIEWLLDVISERHIAHQHQVFRIENLQLIDFLKLKRRKGYRYAFSEFQPHLKKIDEESHRARQLASHQRDSFDHKVLELSRKIHLYTCLVQSHSIMPINNKEHLMAVYRQLQYFSQFNLPHTIPSINKKDDQWITLAQGLFYNAATIHLEGEWKNKPNPLAQQFQKLLLAYREQKADAFNRELKEYQSLLSPIIDTRQKKADYEVFFNHFEPFYHSAVLYAFAFLLSCFGSLGLTKFFNKSAFLIICFTALIHTAALISRIYLSGYPPVTNLYSSAIFIGWGCVLLGIVLECLYKIGAGNLIAAISGFLTLIVAHFLAGDGDTMEMMQAVLDTKFWLATHVTTVTMGYTATFFAGGIAILYLLRGTLTKSLDAKLEKSYSRMIYGTICFGMFMSFVGTVLGGLWADDSWGRFWGWDPKENGALMIVLWNALILHAKWGAMVKTRGMATLAIFGNIITAWSWFGVNELGVGLHSYGFTEGAKLWLGIFMISQLHFMFLGMLPKTWWRSHSLLNQ